MPKFLYQWILQDNQEFSYARFELTSTFHDLKEDLLKYYPNLLETKNVIGPYPNSQIIDEKIIKKILKTQGKTYAQNL